jgi:hypothetical protein
MGHPRRHCTPDLFIYFIVPAFYGSSGSVWVSLQLTQSLMHHYVICDIFHTICGVKEVKVSVIVMGSLALVL